MGSQGSSTRTGISGFQKLGIGLAVAFYVSAVAYVHFPGGKQVGFDPDVKVLTLAHWQLEDGFREGFDKMIVRFERLKAEQGVKVRVAQTTVPYRGYRQWQMTQLVGGDPADVMANAASRSVRHQYFRPLSPYLGKPNPFNAGTPLEGIPWKDTYIDGMEGAFDHVYAEYYALGTAFFTYRLHVNVDLVEKATGSRRMPEDLVDWLDICRKIRTYGERIGQPLSPIGVRGFDKATLSRLFLEYYSQTNGQLNDEASRFCDGVAEPADIVLGLKGGTIDAARLTAVGDILSELGQYFVEGFTAVDLEQSKFLFYSGKVAFFPEGTWNSLSLVQNSPFEVVIIRIPPIGHRHRHSKYFTGKLTESGVRVWGSFGIPKATRHFDLALELLQFMTSYDINQMTMNECKWAPAVKQARYEGILEAFQPDMTGNLDVRQPFYVGWRSKSQDRTFQVLEEIIMKHIRDPGEYFMRKFRQNRAINIAETEEQLVEYQRDDLSRETQRSQLSVGLLRGDLTVVDRERLVLRKALADEALTEAGVRRFMETLYLRELRSF